MTVANGILAFFAFLEIIFILSRARNGNTFIENWQSYADHLNSNSGEKGQVQQEVMSSAVNIPQEPGNPEHPEPARAQNDLDSAVQTLKENRLQDTEKLNDLKQPFGQLNHGQPEAMEKMWEHMKSNIILFSFYCTPMNCFRIFHWLLKIILSESSQAAELPTKMTDIYKMTAKMFLFDDNREGFSLKEHERLKSTHMYEPFDKFPEELKKMLNSLGEIAFKGIEEGRLLFEPSEVSGLEDCGLLHKLPDKKPKALGDPPKSQFCFTHLTVQEFFAAKHLVDTKTKEKIERFVRKNINDDTWQMVLQFVAGLLKSSSDIFIELLPELTKKRTELIYFKLEERTFWPLTEEDTDLAVQVCKCLYEINDEQQQVLQNKIEKIQFNAVEFSDWSHRLMSLLSYIS